MKRENHFSKNAIIAMVIVCALVSAGVAGGFYSYYSGIIGAKDQTIKSLNERVTELLKENQTDDFIAMNASLNAQIMTLQNQIQDQLAQIDSLNSQIKTLQSQMSSSGGNTDSETAQIALYQQQVSDLQNQISAKDTDINSLIQLNTISSLADFNDSTVWLDQASGTFTQIATQSVSAGNTLSINGLNIIPGKAYFVNVNMVMDAPSNATATAYFYVNGDTNNSNYDTSYLYGNARWPTLAAFQYENDPRIFDNGQFAGPMGIIFSGVMEIDPIGTLRMALTYNAYDNLRMDLEQGLYAWIYSGTNVTSVSSIFMNSSMPITGTLGIYGMES